MDAFPDSSDDELATGDGRSRKCGTGQESPPPPQQPPSSPPSRLLGSRVVSLTTAPSSPTAPVSEAVPISALKLDGSPLKKRRTVAGALAEQIQDAATTALPVKTGPSSRVTYERRASVCEEETLLENAARKIQVDEHEEKLRQKRDPRTVFVKGTKRLPKYIGTSPEKVIFTPSVVKERIVDAILNGSDGSGSGRSSSPPSPDNLTVTVNDHPSDAWSVLLTARGRSDLVNQVGAKVNDVINEHMVAYDLRSLLRDGASLELDLIFDCSQRGDRRAQMGINYYDVVPSLQGTVPLPGLWFEPKKGKQMWNIIGPASDRGGAILRVDGKAVNSAAAAREAWREAAFDNARSTAVVTICVHRDADLSGADRTRIRSNCPRRRDGGAYRGKFHATGGIGGGSGGGKSRSPPTPTMVMEEGREAAAATTAKRKRHRPDDGEPPSATRKAAIDLQADYKRFREKILPVHEIEYKNYGINGQFTNKFMWAQHKKIYGGKCDDKCPCPSDLPRLTERVVSDFIKRQTEKEGDGWDNLHGLQPGEYPVGFAGFFAPKFYDKVSGEMPDANPAQVLEKLILMWAKHKEERRFGLKCGRKCRCGEGWEPIFKAKVLRAKPSKGSRAGGAPAAATAAAAVSTVTAPVPAPVQRSTSAPVTPAAPAASSSAQPAKPASLARATTEPATQAKSGSLLRQMLPQQQQGQRKFHALFDKSLPLGMFCFTEPKQRSMDGRRSVCKVASVCPYGTSSKKKDARIKNGTIILGSAPFSIKSPNEEMQPLYTHFELKSRYEAAKKKKDVTKIRIWFINSDVSPSVAGNVGAKRDWTSSGAWVGQSKLDGWAGGAPAHKKSGPKDIDSLLSGPKKHPRQQQANGPPSPPTKLPRQNSDPAIRTNQSLVSRPSDATPNDAVNEQEVSKRASLAKKILAQSGQAPNGHSGETPKSASQTSKRTGSILLDKNRKKVKKKVSFSLALKETKMYTVDTAHAVGSVVDSLGHTDGTSDNIASFQSAPKAASIDMDVPIQQRRSKRLFNAIADGDYRDVITILKEGAPPNLGDASGKLPMDYVKDRIGELETKLVDVRAEDKARISSLLQDAQRKKTVLKIYLQALHYINMAKYMREWVNLEISPLRVNDLVLTETGRFHPATDYLFCVVLLDSRPQEPSMPLIPYSPNPDWTTVADCPKYHLGFNKKMEYSYARGREIKIDLNKGSSSITGKNLKVGTWTESVECIKDILDLSSNREIKRDLPRNEVLERGSMTVRVKTAQLSQDFYKRKREEISKELGKVMDWIDSFKTETGADGVMLEPNISFPSAGDLSILHAAVYAADIKLVNRLLALGADPAAKSEVGPAENLAVNLADESKADSVVTGGTHDALVDIMHALKRSIGARNTNKQISGANLEHGLSQNVSEQETTTGPNESQLQAASGGSYAVNTGHQQAGTYGPADTSVQSLPQYGQNPTNAVNIDPSLLPTISPVDWIKGKYERCNLFHRQGGCSYGFMCKKAHVHAPIGLILENAQSPWSSDHEVMMYNGGNFMASCIHVKASPDVSGKNWYTAAYLDPAENIIYYAERGSRSAQSRQGIYWYPEEGDAIVAAKRVVLVAKQANTDLSPIQAAAVAALPPMPAQMPPPMPSVQQPPPPMQSVQPPPPPPPMQSVQPPPPPPPPPPPRSLPPMPQQNFYAPPVPPPMAVPAPPPHLPPPPSSMQPVGGSIQDVNMHANIYHLLVKGDLQAIYVKIHPGNVLKRTVWRTEQKKVGGVTYTTTQFQSPAREDDRAVYFPYGHDGTYDGSRWWYQEEKAAKASAFLRFLVHAAERGLVNADLKGTRDGKKFFGKRR